MTSAEARIETERASRYLRQLCSHAASITEAGGRPMRHFRRPGAGSAEDAARDNVRLHSEWSETHGVIRFNPQGQCTADATTTTLTLRIDAADEAKLLWIQQIITRNLNRFGRRDRLVVVWHPIEVGDPSTR